CVIAGASGNGWYAGSCCCWTSGGSRPPRPLLPTRERSHQESALPRNRAPGVRKAWFERWGSARSVRINREFEAVELAGSGYRTRPIAVIRGVKGIAVGVSNNGGL